MTSAEVDTILACSCCARPYARSKLHSLGESAYICRRCGLWVALRRGSDPAHG